MPDLEGKYFAVNLLPSGMARQYGLIGVKFRTNIRAVYTHFSKRWTEEIQLHSGRIR